MEFFLLKQKQNSLVALRAQAFRDIMAQDGKIVV
jgi:hypothetical protein